MSKKIRTAVVGLNMGLQHAYAFHESEQADLRWVVDLDEARAKSVAEELGCSYTSDWTAILDEVDAVSLCTPHHLHAPQALQAIAAGKHVLVEKPLANTEEDCLRVIRAAEEKKVTLMMAYVLRYIPAIVRLKEVLNSGRYGRPINASCWVEGFLPPNPDSWFARKEKLGGGVLFSHGCHYVDLLLWFFGKPELVASLGTRLGTEWMEGEGTAHATIAFSSGTLGHVSCSWGIKHSGAPARFHIQTTEGLLALPADYRKIEWVTDKGTETIYEEAPASIERKSGSVKYEVEHFLSCIAGGREPETNGRDALRSHRTIWAMYASRGEKVPEAAR
ncbi:Gfo/Idh/MocA family protein [Cohnella rhizosphaerae]|uniref:Gfo/Idh/MocA family oxidoreductase n=1 Tax=Cohnella rhizosphaerae TaxID=1457232 RepID=A0A9X4KZZ4_9BACL|nr:Gfo/Idh/MocA family oxidoreductase [Cohnella rhizosphaerae]MDG0813601.1 Gfo/Idh/MocA family oxidoreductase [Cohnella rhizosphaerae]